MTPTPEPAIALHGVTVREGRRLVLASIDLTVDIGQACAIVGPNGSGKSVLLRVVAGLRRPSGGRIEVGGWNALTHAERVRRLIGYVPDEPGLAERLTPMEHLEMVTAQRGLSRADGQAAAESMLELVDLMAHARTYVTRLSRGQRRRLALALALVHDPPILLLDEPSVGVDDVGRGELTSILLELRSMGKTMLLASQASADVAEVCDVIAPLVDGHLGPSTQHNAVSLTWIEIVGEVAPALLRLREHPGVDDLRHSGSFVTFQGPVTPEERAEFAEWLVASGVHLSGFGITSTPAGGDHA